MRTAHWVAATAAAVMLLAGCSDAEEPAQDVAPTATAQDEVPQDGTAPALPEPDLEGVPEVVAEVDGVRITREEFASVYEGHFEQAAMQAQMTGEEVDQDALRRSTADALVETQLLLAEAERRSISPSQEDVDAAAQELAEAGGMASTDELFSALEAEGMDRETAMGELRMQTALEQLVADEAGEFSATEEELQARYDEVAEQAGPDAGLPDFAEVRDQVEAELRREHENVAAQALIDRLRDEADITMHF